MYYRRKILLATLEKCQNRTLAKRNLQKVLFLFSQKQDSPQFNFIPHHEGCFSFEAHEDLRILAGHYKSVTDEDKFWHLATTSASEEDDYYEQSLKVQDRTQLQAVFDTFDVSNHRKLATAIYKNYPYYAIRTKAKFSQVQKDLIAKEQQQITRQNRKTLFSIGYEGTSIDTYLNTLIANNVSLLFDVRGNPWSMKYHFSKNRLAAYCKEINIDYFHCPTLGIAGDQRKNLKSPAEYQKLFKDYKKTLGSRKEGLAVLLEHLKKYKRIALTCFEKDPKDCHRNVLTEYFQNEHGVKSSHL